MIFFGMCRESLQSRTPLFFCPLIVTSSICHGDCQLSWLLWKYRLVWEVHYVEVSSYFEVR